MKRGPSLSTIAPCSLLHPLSGRLLLFPLRTTTVAEKKTTPSRAPGTARTIASPLFPPFSTTIRSGTPQVNHVARSPPPPLISAAVDTYRLLSHVVTTRLIRGLGAKLSEQRRTTLVFAVAAACIHLRPTLAPCNPHHLRNPSRRVVLAFFFSLRRYHSPRLAALPQVLAVATAPNSTGTHKTLQQTLEFTDNPTPYVTP